MPIVEWDGKTLKEYKGELDDDQHQRKKAPAFLFFVDSSIVCFETVMRAARAQIGDL